MRNILKKSSVLIAVLMAAMLFAGISCFAYEQDTISTEPETYVSEIADNEAVEAQEIQLYEAQSSEDKSLGKSLAIGLGSGLYVSAFIPHTKSTVQQSHISIMKTQNSHL